MSHKLQVPFGFVICKHTQYPFIRLALGSLHCRHVLVLLQLAHVLLHCWHWLVEFKNVLFGHIHEPSSCSANVAGHAVQALGFLATLHDLHELSQMSQYPLEVNVVPAEQLQFPKVEL